MQVSTLDGLFSHPSFICILATILVTLGNIIVGVSILPQDKRKKRYKLHQMVYLLVIGVFGFFLWVNSRYQEEQILSYMVFAYFVVAIPWSRKANVTLHAIVASLGLVMLISVAAFNVL